MQFGATVHTATQTMHGNPGINYSTGGGMYTLQPTQQLQITQAVA